MAGADPVVREGFLGSFADMLGETFNFRFAEDTRRMDELMNLKRLHADSTRNLTLIWTYPDKDNGMHPTPIPRRGKKQI